MFPFGLLYRCLYFILSIKHIFLMSAFTLKLLYKCVPEHLFNAFLRFLLVIKAIMTLKSLILGIVLPLNCAFWPIIRTNSILYTATKRFHSKTKRQYQFNEIMFFHLSTKLCDDSLKLASIY